MTPWTRNSETSGLVFGTAIETWLGYKPFPGIRTSKSVTVKETDQSYSRVKHVREFLHQSFKQEKGIPWRHSRIQARNKGYPTCSNNALFLIRAGFWLMLALFQIKSSWKSRRIKLGIKYTLWLSYSILRICVSEIFEAIVRWILCCCYDPNNQVEM